MDKEFIKAMKKIGALEARIEELEKKLKKVEESSGAARSAAQAALYVANYG